MPKLARYLLYAFYLLLTVLILLEIMVRVCGYADRYFYDPIYLSYSKSQEIPYVMKPNLRQVRAHGNIWVNTDSLGLRSPVPARTYDDKQADEYRIAFVGNSVTFGVGVPTGATYPESVEKSLNQQQKHCRVAVFNFAVSSYSIKEMIATLKHRVPEVNPDLVVMGIVIDDFDTGRTLRIDKWGYNTYSGPSQLINRFPTIKLILRKIHLSYVFRDMVSRTIMYEDKNYESMRGKLPPIIAGSYHYIEKFKKIAEEYGYSYFVLTLPSADGDGSQFTEVIKNLKRDQINVYDVSSITPLFTVKDYQASPYDWHPSPMVHQKIANLVSAFILNNYLDKDCH